ncbi:hypothetical protein [Bradyrhizobium sp. LMTR 3]|uniref:hypothetical protein n=1 Tax=Bradyrhizobium sp. LMTR 3 TaxID=189873 RepID=UPI0008108E18|nr:hypothetical protein [Bradyrhizobium sp. LMTR 3]OCK61648.1 hypothetical protein LMTR3_03785 [Bradyrhizobium sp. LMTR 3]
MVSRLLEFGGGSGLRDRPSERQRFDRQKFFKASFLEGSNNAGQRAMESIVPVFPDLTEDEPSDEAAAN